MPRIEPPGLRRVLGLGLLVFYGLGVIIGAGIYVLVGTVVGKAGPAAPFAFLAAGLMAALTGICYAELGARFPEAAGAAAYVKLAFGSDRLSQVTGLAVAAAALVSAASIARGCVGYAQLFVNLPGPVIAGGLVVAFTALACLGVRESVGVAALMSLIEIAGLLFVTAVGSPALVELPARAPSMIPADAAGWAGVSAGAFLAFFAFIGFENLANMAEEAKDPHRTLPRAILFSIALSAALYIVVSVVTILAVPFDLLRTSPAPLLLVVQGTPWGSPSFLAAIALLSIANGVLIQILMLARLFYGMASHGWLPRPLSVVHRTTRVPVRATLLSGALTLFFTLAIPFESLVAATSTLTLLIFTLVSLGLWRLHRGAPPSTDRRFTAPRWVPPAAAAAGLGLIAAQFLT